MSDLYAPTVVDDAGNILPIQPLSALGADDGTNLLNPAGRLQAIGLSSKAPGAGGIEIIGFEDRLNTSPAYDGDFNDAIVAVSEAPIAAATLRHLRLEARGAPDDDRTCGGDDLHAGGRGADWFEGGNGADTFRFSATALGADRIADFDAGEGDFIAPADFGAGFGCAALDTNNDGRAWEGHAGGGVEIALAGVASLGAGDFFIT